MSTNNMLPVDNAEKLMEARKYTGWFQSELREAQRIDAENERLNAERRRAANVAKNKADAVALQKRREAQREAEEARRAKLLARPCEAQLYGCLTTSTKLSDNSLEAPAYAVHALCSSCADKLFVA